jgi:hypothetical protein
MVLRRVTLSMAMVGAATTALFLACAWPADAALGDQLPSVQADQLRLGGTLRSAPMPGYLLHEIRTPTGATVREFASPAGTVFGVAWDGPFFPDLHQLMGRYFDLYSQAAAQRRRGHGPVVIETPDLVFESGGHPRHFHGRAYVPGLMPADVPADALQ